MNTVDLHPIDQRKDHWINEDLDRMMVFCLLDRAMPYVRVCELFDVLDSHDMTTREGIKSKTHSQILDAMKAGRARFPKQTAIFLKKFADTKIDLRTASRKDLITIPGIGMKLASMFIRNTRGEDVAVLDVHLKKWLKEEGLFSNNYEKAEMNFLEKAKELGKDPYQLDLEIWDERRIVIKEVNREESS